MYICIYIYIYIYVCPGAATAVRSGVPRLQAEYGNISIHYTIICYNIYDILYYIIIYYYTTVLYYNIL